MRPPIAPSPTYPRFAMRDMNRVSVAAVDSTDNETGFLRSKIDRRIKPGFVTRGNMPQVQETPVSSSLARAGLRLSAWFERWFPDAFALALLAVAIVFA